MAVKTGDGVYFERTKYGHIDITIHENGHSYSPMLREVTIHRDKWREILYYLEHGQELVPDGVQECVNQLPNPFADRSTQS